MDADQALNLALKLYKQLDDRRPEIEEYDDYFRGEQPLAYASAEWADFHQNRYAGFSDNWCAPVASAPAERIALNGIQLPKSISKRAASQSWDDWKANDGEEQSSQGFLQSITTKRSFTIVWGDENDEPEFSWEHPSQVIVAYEPGNRRRKIAALKAWEDDTHEYMTLYEPEALWKWRRRSSLRIRSGQTKNGLLIAQGATMAGSQWEPYQPASDDVWPLPNPLGRVNVIEWPNRPMLAGGPMSDIAGTKAMQDAVNLLWAYLFGAADYASMPARVVMGAEAPKVPVLNEQGQKVGERPVDIKDLQQGRFLWLTGQHAKIGEYAPSRLDVFTGVIEQAIAHIAAQTRTPSHYLINSGNVPAAGYELAEAGLVEKVKEFHLFSQAPVREHFALMALVRGDKKLAGAMRVATPSWENAAVRSDAQMADALLKKRQMGYPLEWIAREDGLSPSEITDLMEMVRREQQDPYLTRLDDKDAADAGAEPADLGG